MPQISEAKCTMFVYGCEYMWELGQVCSYLRIPSSEAHQSLYTVVQS